MILPPCCLLTFVFYLVLVSCFFPCVCVLIINMRLELEPWEFFWCAFLLLLFLLLLMTCSVDMHLDSSLPCEKGVMCVVNRRTSVGFRTNSCWSVVVSCKRNVTGEEKMVLWGFGFLLVRLFFLRPCLWSFLAPLRSWAEWDHQ